VSYDPIDGAQLPAQVPGTALYWSAREELVQGLIPRSSRPTSLYGLPGVGKGLFAVTLGVKLLLGQEFFGLATGKPLDWVGYFDAEDDISEFARRVIKTFGGPDLFLDALKHASTRRKMEKFFYQEVPFQITTDPRQIEFEDTRPVIERRLAQWAKHGPRGLVFWDSAQAIFGGNQIGAEVGDGVYIQIMRWAKLYGFTPVIIDHTAWGGEHELGTVFKRARVISSLHLKQRYRGSDEDGPFIVIDLTNKKSNSGLADPDTPVLSIKVTFGEFEDGDQFTSLELTDPPNSKKQGERIDARAQLLNALPGTYKDLAKDLGWPESRVAPLLSRLKKEGLIANGEDKIWYQL
jgi:hypothetical protein